MEGLGDGLAKVLFRSQDEDGSERAETLWVQSLGNDEYKVDNLPYYTYGVSLGDVVYAPITLADAVPTFQKVISKSGNRTIRIYFSSTPTREASKDMILKTLVGFGCDYEGANSRYFSINVPPSSDLAMIYQYLDHQNAEWESGDP